MTAWPRRAAPAGALLVAAALGLGACGGGSPGPASTTGSASPPARQSTSAVGQRAGGFGAAAQGEIAEISGRTLQVQNSTEQTAVTYSAKTTFTAERATTRSAVRVGTCIVATAPSSSGSPSGAPAAARAITATAVRIVAASNGSCTGGFVGRAGVRPSDLPTRARPSGFPTGARPSGFPSGAVRRFGNAVAGKVTAVSGSTITVAATLRPRGGSASSSVGSASSSVGTVHVTSGTKYTTTGRATHAALKVGLCAVVNGSTDSTGAVAATRIALSQKVNGSCGGGPNG